MRCSRGSRSRSAVASQRCFCSLVFQTSTVSVRLATRAWIDSSTLVVFKLMPRVRQHPRRCSVSVSSRPSSRLAAADVFRSASSRRTWVRAFVTAPPHPTHRPVLTRIPRAGQGHHFLGQQLPNPVQRDGDQRLNPRHLRVNRAHVQPRYRASAIRFLDNPLPFLRALSYCALHGWCPPVRGLASLVGISLSYTEAPPKFQLRVALTHRERRTWNVARRT